MEEGIRRLLNKERYTLEDAARHREPCDDGQARLRAAKIAETTGSRQIQMQAAFRFQHSHECRRCPERFSSNSKLHTRVSASRTPRRVVSPVWYGSLCSAPTRTQGVSDLVGFPHERCPSPMAWHYLM